MGSRFSASVANSTVDRMYHSSATLLPDGSIFSSGSNPNADFIAPGTPGYKYPTEYRVERFYPDYYTLPRPAPTGVPTTIGYGGNYFNISLPASSVGAISNLDNTKVTIIRPGFSTHAMNMGQRYVQLSVSHHSHLLDVALTFCPRSQCIVVHRLLGWIRYSSRLATSSQPRRPRTRSSTHLRRCQRSSFEWNLGDGRKWSTRSTNRHTLPSSPAERRRIRRYSEPWKRRHHSNGHFSVDRYGWSWRNDHDDRSEWTADRHFSTCVRRSQARRWGRCFRVVDVGRCWNTFVEGAVLLDGIRYKLVTRGG